MSLVVGDRVAEVTFTAGTGAIALGGVADGRNATFASRVGNGNTTYYVIVHQTANEWELGVGTFTTGPDTLARTLVIANHLGTTALVNFSAGVKDVFVDLPAEALVFKNLSSGLIELVNPLLLTVSLSGASNALDVQLSHSGGAVGFQEGHGINLKVNFTPLAGTNRGMQSQKITCTLFGAAAVGGGIDNATMDSLDLSTIIDASRTGGCALILGVTAAVHKFNTVDDRPTGGTLIGGQFITDIQAGAVSLVAAIQGNAIALAGTTVTEFYGLELLRPIGGAGTTISTRMAAIYVEDWSVDAMAAQGATAAGGYVLYALGGGIVLHNGDFEVENASTGLILKSPNGTRYRVTVDNTGTLIRTGL